MHIRICAVVGVMGLSGKRIVPAVVDGGPCESEVKMAMRVLGTIKSKLSSHIYAKREDMARKEVLARMILWNIYILERLSEGDNFSFLHFLALFNKKVSKTGWSG